MRLRHVGLWGSLALTLCGCPEPPDNFVPVTPPGAVIPRTPPDEKPAEAQGEGAILAAKTGESAELKKPAAYTPAAPTAKGETKTTKNGTKYETLKEGTGDELKPGHVGRFHYVGTLENGTEFDSSRKRGQPAPFAIGTGKLIKGWDEALPGMKVGEVRKLTVPPDQAYGAANKGKIPPNSTLHFEIELLGLDN